MNSSNLQSPVDPQASNQGHPKRLNSWKEIAAYFDRDIRTVQLWEKKEALPVHRHEHDARSSVYAFPAELDQWLNDRRRTHGPTAVTPAAAAPAEQAPQQAWTPSRILRIAIPALLLLAALAYIGWRFRHRAAPRSSLTIVLADFVNTTAEPVFDDTLNTALRAKLQQSPYLVFMPDAKLQLAMRYMGRPSGERLTLDLARQACAREDGQVVLQGSIANSPQGYIVGLRTIDCTSGRLIAQLQQPSIPRSSILGSLDHAAEDLRSALGESADSIQRYSVSLDDATTGSLDALTAYTQGNRLWYSQGESAALPSFRHAVDLDPNFAIAYARMGTILGNMGEWQRSKEALRKAYDLRNRVTEWERFYIASHYFAFATGDIANEMQVYHQWSLTYPHDMAWIVNLSVDYGFSGQFEKAIDLQKRAILQNSTLSPAYGNLAQFYLADEHPDEAQAVLDQAAQMHVRDSNTELAAYWLAYYRDQPAAMAAISHDTLEQPGLEDLLLDQQAATADSQGHLAEGLAFAEHAAASADHAGNQELRSQWLANEAVRQALFGQAATSRQLLTRALSSSNNAPGRNLSVLAALALTLMPAQPRAKAAQDLAMAKRIIEDLNHNYPQDTLIHSYWVPILQARVAYARGQFDQVPPLLKDISSYDLGIFTPGQCMDATFLRGEALLAANQPAAATSDFRRVLEHRGLVVNCPTLPLAQLNLARSLARSGNTVAARSAYQDLFARWKDADPTLPVVRQAHTEYSAL